MSTIENENGKNEGKSVTVEKPAPSAPSNSSIAYLGHCGHSGNEESKPKISRSDETPANTAKTIVDAGQNASKASKKPRR